MQSKKVKEPNGLWKKIFFKVPTKRSDHDQLNQIETRFVTKPSTGKNGVNLEKT